jgi:hypothetical protein
MKKLLFFSILLLLVNSGCSVYETMVNISRLKFKLGNVDNFQVAGVNISNKTRIEEINPIDLLRLSSTFASGKLPVSFTLNVEAKNPNDGTGGYPKTDATLKSFPWRLEIDGIETIAGNIGSPVTVPGTGELTYVPLTLNLDLLEFFNSQGYESLINMVFAIGGSEGTSARLTLMATPTVSTPLGDMKYPGELKIVDQTFTN